MRKIFTFIAAAAFALSLAACGASGETDPPSAPQSGGSAATEPSATPAPTPPTSTPTPQTPENAPSTLIVYFSLTGTTEQVANTLQEKTGADIYFLESETPYSKDHDTAMAEAQAERNSGTLRTLKDTLPDISAYDFILIGGPVWMGEPSNPVQQYLNATDFTGKKVVGFWTAGGNPANYADKLKELVQGGEVLDGFSLIGTGELDSKADAWLEELEILQ